MSKNNRTICGLDGGLGSSAAADTLSCLCVALPLYVALAKQMKREFPGAALAGQQALNR